MHLFKKKKAETEEKSDEADKKTSGKAGKGKKDEKSSKGKEEKAEEKKENAIDKEQDQEDDGSESGSETESSEESDEETENTGAKDSNKNADGETKKDAKGSNEKVDEEKDDDGSESEEESSEEESSAEEETKADESAPDETEPVVSETEDVTTAADATLDMSAAPTDLDGTLNTTGGELPDEQEDEEEDMFEAIDDYAGEEEGDLAIAVGDRLVIIHRQDDGWWEAENERGDRGLVPSTYLKKMEVPQSPASPGSTKSAKMLWGSLKKAVRQKSTSDVLQMMGSVPTGFRKDYLKTKAVSNKTEVYLTPKLAPSHLYFSDLIYSPAQGMVKHRTSQWCRIIQLNEFRNIPLPAQGATVKKRCVRICLFDGTNVCSNLIQVDAQCLDKEEKIWTFNHKETDFLQSGKLGEVFVRTDQKNANIGVLFELSVTFVRESSDTETEMICGWSLLPLYEETGMPAQNKVIELPVNGGTPEEQGVALDANLGQNEQANIFRSLLMRSKEPRFVAKILPPGKEQKELLDALPDTIIGSAAHISAFAYYRQIIADQLLRDRMDISSTELISDPFMANFPRAANDTFYMDILRHSWIEAQKRFSRQQKKDPMIMKNAYIKCFMDRIYPRLGLSEEHLAKERKEHLATPLKPPKQLDPLSMLLSPDLEFRPFHTNEIAFSIVNKNCKKVF